MTKEEFDNIIDSANVPDYFKSADTWVSYGVEFEEYDIVLATIAKRIANDYRQYAERIRAHRMNAMVEKHNAEFDEVESMQQQIQDIVKKAGSK